jgi:hypothetical protein
MSSLAAQIFERFITRSGFAGGYYWSSLNKETVAEFSASDTGRADLIQNVIDGELTVERALKIARRRRLAVTLDHAAESGRHAHSERGLDLYSTPPEAVEALLRVETLPHTIWEPAAGRNAIINVLRGVGHTVIASDIADYGAELAFIADFLAMKKAPVGVEAIVTNLPYKLATEFVCHALEFCPRVYVLLRLAFLESAKRTPILDTGKLARIHVFKQRLPMMHRDGWAGPRASSAIPFAWFSWRSDHKGPATIDRI